MQHERFAPLLYRSVLVGVILGVVALIQALAGQGPTLSPLPLAVVGITPPVLVALFFLLVVILFSANGRGLSLWSGAALLMIAALQLFFLLGSESPGDVAAPVPRFMNFAYALLVAMVLAAYVAHRLNQTYGLLAALLFLTTPPLLLPSDGGVLSLDMVFYWTSTLLCLFLWSETGKRAWLVVGGLCLGFAAGVVPWDSALVFGCVNLGVLVFLGRRTDRREGTASCATLLFVCSAIPLAVWSGVGYFSPAGGAADAAPLVVPPGGMGILKSISQSILLLPSGEELVPHTLTLGPAAVCFLPWAFKGKWGHEKRILWAAVLLVVVSASYTGALKTLGFLPILPLLAVLASFGIHNLYVNVKRPALLFSSVAIALGWNGITFWNHFTG